MVVEAWMESQEVGRLKLCVEPPPRLTGLDGAPGSLLLPIVELFLRAENAMMRQQQGRPLMGWTPTRCGSQGAVAAAALFALADPTV